MLNSLSTEDHRQPKRLSPIRFPPARSAQPRSSMSVSPTSGQMGTSRARCISRSVSLPARTNELDRTSPVDRGLPQWGTQPHWRRYPAQGRIRRCEEFGGWMIDWAAAGQPIER